MMDMADIMNILIAQGARRQHVVEGARWVRGEIQYQARKTCNMNTTGMAGG